MTPARLGHILFGIVGAASAVFVHLLPAPWQLETGGAAGPPLHTAPATPPVAIVPSRERPPSEPAIAAAEASALPTATPHPAGPAVPGLKPTSAGLAPPASAPGR